MGGPVQMGERITGNFLATVVEQMMVCGCIFAGQYVIGMGEADIFGFRLLKRMNDQTNAGEVGELVPQ